jgi:hypothetical protein
MTSLIASLSPPSAHALAMTVVLRPWFRALLVGVLLTSGMGRLVAGEPADVDIVILDNQQRIPGALEDDPESADFALIRTISGTLRLKKLRITAVELGVTSRLKQIQADDLDGLIEFARWCRAKGHQQAALTALDKAFNLARVDPKRTWDVSALALYARLTDEISGPEAALPLYRWYRSAQGKDAETIARLDQLEKIVGRSDEAIGPPPVLPRQPVANLEKPITSTSGAEGLEIKGWQGENPQWSNPVQTRLVPLIGDDRLEGVKNALEVQLDKGDRDKATIKKPVNVDASEDHVLAIRVRNKSERNLRIAVALKTGQWVYYESMQQTVKGSDGWKELRFDLKGKDFKSQKSEWANNATIESLDELKEIQVLIYNQNAEGTALISGMRFLSDKEL